MAGAKQSAFAPSAKYSSQPDESTTFTRDPCRAARRYRYRAGNRAFFELFDRYKLYLSFVYQYLNLLPGPKTKGQPGLLRDHHLIFRRYSDCRHTIYSSILNALTIGNEAVFINKSRQVAFFAETAYGERLPSIDLT